MDAASQTKMDRDQIYSILRREIVLGVIASDQEVTSAELDLRFACSAKVTSEVLSTLAGDGYLRKTKGGYVPDESPSEEVCDFLKLDASSPACRELLTGQ
ncbi:hypothetical protein [Novosphingobium sp. 9U]|uniref:hypothetical protein n=1 Tax=Novosphingobium sp. 9U TaxID=2653158 RepID=UPI0012F2B5BE|nr:hypothetical protein [Novosphingobium sp. 9U]VWX49877.1 hypothetical protein NOVOSPHI9U_260071 [Novosphingobium sp. 9U]